MGVPIHPPRYQALYRACIKAAAARGAALMQATLTRALHDMPLNAAQIPDIVGRNLLLDAASVLRERQEDLAEAFPQALLAEFTHAMAGDRASTLSFASLPLLGDEQLQDNAQVVRSTRILQQAVGRELTDLEGLLAAADIAPRGQRHPLRPEVYVRALDRLACQSPVSPAVRRCWVPHLVVAMAPELAAAYFALADLLRAQGLRSVAPPPSAPAVSDAATQLTIRELRKLLGADMRPIGEGAMEVFIETEFPHTLPAALQVLQDLRKVDQVMLELRQRQVAMPDSGADSLAAFREALRQQAQRPAQALGLEVVHQMVENLAGDPRLLPPVQAAVRELEPALLRLALVDPRFFSDSTHPARRLLEQVTERSLAWSSTSAEGFADFIEGLDQAVEVLLDHAASGTDAFEIALVALRDAWEEAQPRGRRTREKAVRALLRAEQRNLLAERIAGQLLARADAQGAPREALAFLAGPWAQVMAHARLGDTGGATDPDGREHTATLMLWSVQPALAGRVAAQQQELARRLEEGLDSIEHFSVESDRWLALLKELGTLALSTATGAVAYAEEAGGQPPRADTWLAPMEAHDSGFVSGPGAFAAPAAVDPEPDALPSIELLTGAWVDLLGDFWERWQLTWTSPHGLLFMFAHASGATRSMTRNRLQQMLSQGALRLVAAQAVVDGALDAVARAAWRNTVRDLEEPRPQRDELAPGSAIESGKTRSP